LVDEEKLLERDQEKIQLVKFSQKKSHRLDKGVTSRKPQKKLKNQDKKNLQFKIGKLVKNYVFLVSFFYFSFLSQKLLLLFQEQGKIFHAHKKPFKGSFLLANFFLPSCIN
jgi:hypothetical protein